MTFDPKKHRRRSIRLRHYNYQNPGTYFITICTYQRELLFQNPRYQAIAEEQWALSKQIREEIQLDAFVVMPNHIHGIVWIMPTGSRDARPGRGARPCTPTGPGSPNPSSRPTWTVDRPAEGPVVPPAKPQVPPRSLGAFVRGYKSAVTREINNLRVTPGRPIWQRNYYEHVIRNEADLYRIRQYIQENPLRWAFDRENPSGMPDKQENDFWDYWGDM